jgi:F-type H+/Na+-transporting ATPase subunit alpha
MIYLTTKGLLDTVPVNKIREFEKEYITILQATQKETLVSLKAGKLDEHTTSVLEQVAKDVAAKY